ncbi:hypothetical protein A4A49_21874 [Nicotiana attenuata]|uniref:Uncharacterized protein n=1 Tax=Nicotiana attenuata TaxID=49451 RepID=A0A1J6I3F4_NICAT|nr:hypothetical protein A4A49_21874 [Nicotiana attenuata]
MAFHQGLLVLLVMTLVMAMAIVAENSSLSHTNASALPGIVEDTYEDEEMMMPTADRRARHKNGHYISREAMSHNSISCNCSGPSYHQTHCIPMQKVKSHKGDCSIIKCCRRR